MTKNKVRKDRPAIIIRGCCNPAAGEDGLALDKHFFTGRKYSPVRDHEIFRNGRVRNNHEQLISEPERIQLSESFGPVVQYQLRVFSQEWK